MLCIVCEKEQRLKGRRYCRQCYLERKRKLERIRYKNYGRTKYTIICQACGKEYNNADRKEQKFCSDCWKQRQKFISKYNVKNPYYYQQHKLLAQSLLKRQLDYNTVVHHLDHNYINNVPSNLIVISRSIHVALHNYLYNEQFKLYKQYGEDNYKDKFDIKILTFEFFQKRNYKPILLEDYVVKRKTSQ